MKYIMKYNSEVQYTVKQKNGGVGVFLYSYASLQYGSNSRSVIPVVYIKFTID